MSFCFKKIKSMEEVPSSSRSNNPEINHEDDLRQRPWSDLPDLVLHNIVKHLTDISSYASFGSACTTWRSTSKAATIDFIACQPPSLIAYPSSILPSSKATYNMLTITDNKIHTRFIPEMPDICYQSDTSFNDFWSSHGYFIIDRQNNYGWRPDSQSNSSASPVLVNPFTGSTIVFPAAPCDFLYATLSAPPTSPDCALLLIAHDDFFDSDYHVMLCRIKSTKWTVWPVPGHINTRRGYWRGAVLQHKVYVAHSSMEGIWEGEASSSNLKLLDIQNTDDILMNIFGCHLIGVDSELLMITEKVMPAKDSIEAYRLDWSTMAWRRVMDIGDHVVFLQLGASCQIYDSKRVRGVTKNCVYRAGFRQNSFSIISLSGGEEVNLSLGRAFEDVFGGYPPVWVPMTALFQGYSRDE